MEFTQAFADAARYTPFSGHLTQSQVDGLKEFFHVWSMPAYVNNDLRWFSYVLATACWETAYTMQPVIETFNPARDESNPSVETAIARLEASWKAGHLPWVHTPYWRKDKDGLSWLGRGYAQVTHKENYLRAEQATGIPFTKDPSLMLLPENALPVMLNGMIKGWFTGKKLADYFNSRGGDPLGARRIINGTDHAAEIAKIFAAFGRALVLS